VFNVKTISVQGHGVMVFEDGTHYEGEFKSAGCFNGKGTLTLNTGDRLEGSLQGMWNEGIKFAGTLFKNSSVTSSLLASDRAESKPKYYLSVLSTHFIKSFKTSKVTE